MKGKGRATNSGVVFKTSSNVLPSGHRLENLFWRIWGSDRLHKKLSGSRIACLFMMIQQGEEAFEKDPKLRIPEFGRTVSSRVPQRTSLDIPPTPPPSPIDSYFAGLGGRPPMSRLPSQRDITASLYQAFLQQQQIPVRASPPEPPRVPPPSPATPMASPLLAAVQARAGQAGYFTGGPERPSAVTSNSDNTMMNINSAAIALPRNLSRPPQPSRSSSSTLAAVEEVTPAVQPAAQPKGPKRSDSLVSIAESTTSSTSAKLGKKTASGSKASKKAILPKGKAKFVAGKKGGVRPALARQKSSTSSTVVEQEEDDDAEFEEFVEKTEDAKHQKPVLEVSAKVEETKPIAEVKAPAVQKAHPVERKLVMEVVSDIAEEDFDEFEDEDQPVVAPPPMRRTISAGPTLGGKKNKKGSSTRLSKKNRNVSATAARGGAGLGIAAVLGGPGTKKDEISESHSVVSIVEPDFRRKFQEKHNLTQMASTDNLSVHSGNSSAGSSVGAVESSGKGKRREKLVFLTSEMEARAVKSQATVSVATPTSSVVVAKKVHGSNVLVVEAGEIRGLNTPTVPVAANTIKTENVSGAGIGGSGPATGGSRVSTLSLMIEDAKRKNGGKVGGNGVKPSASVGRK